MDLDHYLPKYGKLNKTLFIVVDEDTERMVNQLKAMNVDFNEFGRDVLIPKIRELFSSMKGTSHG